MRTSARDTIHRLWRSAFARSVAQVAGGSVFAHLLTLLASPVLARLYAPEHIGELGTFLAVAGLLAVVATLRLDAAVVVAPDPAAARRTFVAAISITLVTTIAAAITVSVAAIAAPHTEWASTLRFLPLAVGAVGIYNVGLQWLARSAAFHTIARANVLRSLAMNGWQLGAGAFVASGTNLILGYLAGQIGAAWYVQWRAIRSARGLLREPLGTGHVLALVRQERQFTVFGSLQVLVSQAHNALPIVLLGSWFDAASVGYFVMGHRLLIAPVSLVSESVRRVLYPSLARTASNDMVAVRRSVRKLTLVLVGPVAIVVAALGVTAPAAFAALLGEEWRPAGVWARYLAVWLGTTVINVPSTTAIPILAMQDWLLRFSVVNLIAGALAFAIGASLAQGTTAIAVFALAAAAANLALIFFVDRRLSISIARTDRSSAS